MDQSASRTNMDKNRKQQSLSTKVPISRKSHKQHTTFTPPATTLVRMRQKKGRHDGKLTAILTLNTSKLTLISLARLLL